MDGEAAALAEVLTSMGYGISQAQMKKALDMARAAGRDYERPAFNSPLEMHQHYAAQLAAIRKSAEKFCRNVDRDLFSKWYFGEEGLNSLLQKIAECQEATAQSRTFVGLVQATMVGKTRLILEGSKRTPIILIRLDDTNVAYICLLSFVEREQRKMTRSTSFEDWRACNRRIVLLVRIFFLAYMKYAHLYKVYVAANCKVLHLFSTNPKELWGVREEITRFNASVLNGGQNLVAQLFQEEVAARIDLDDASTTIKVDHQDLARALNGPTFAVDECHMPLSCAVGQLFHSDYEKKPMADVLRWQKYELYRTEDTPVPDGYDYTAPTTLFSAFRWVLEGYLKQTDAHQTTIFASTYFSVWEPLLDESTYSRQKPAIERIFLAGRLSLRDLVRVLKDKHPAAEVERKEVKSVLKKWQGRPGFFFDHFLRRFKAEPSDRPLLERVQSADEQAWLSLCSQFDPGLKKLEKREFTGHLTDTKITGEQVSLFLSFCARIRGGNIYCASAELAHLVSAGFVFVKEYQTGGKSIGIIDEPLVKAYLLQMAKQPDAHKCCDKFIARLIDTASGTGYGNAAEYALANQILTFNGRALAELLGEWGLTIPMPFLNKMVVRASVSTSINDIPDFDPTCLLSQLKDDRLVLPRDGIVMPDACFLASTSKVTAADLCFVTVQCKTVKSKLRGNEFEGAVQSTSINKLFKGSAGTLSVLSTLVALQFHEY